MKCLLLCSKFEMSRLRVGERGRARVPVRICGVHAPGRRPCCQRSQLRQGRGPSTAAAPGAADCIEDDDDAFYLFSQEHKVDRAGLPTARETGLHHHLRAGAVAGVARPGGLSWDEVPVRILRLPQERIAPQAKAAILVPLTTLWLEE